jgi:hypothetical protein
MMHAFVSRPSVFDVVQGRREELKAGGGYFPKSEKVVI